MMNNRLPALAAATMMAIAMPLGASALAQTSVIHRHQGAIDSRNGFYVNRMGYGNYRPGPNGSFAGYPAGSAGAQIMRDQQEDRCRYASETC